MRTLELEWDEATVEHLAKHGIEPEEAQEACQVRPYILRSRRGRYIVLGQTRNGRYVTIIVAPLGHSRAKIITARGMSEQERRQYVER